jgi:hypothetical protein
MSLPMLDLGCCCAVFSSFVQPRNPRSPVFGTTACLGAYCMCSMELEYLQKVAVFKLNNKEAINKG